MTMKETQAHPVPKEELNPVSVSAHPMQVVRRAQVEGAGPVADPAEREMFERVAKPVCVPKIRFDVDTRNGRGKLAA